MATKKGFHVLLEALPALFGRLPDAHVVLAGGGDRLEPSSAPRAAAPGRAASTSRARCSHDHLPDLYRAADLFVLPAVHDAKGNVDGLPNVILEAMASGLPVVASGISGIPLAVVDGDTGLLAAEGDSGRWRRRWWRWRGAATGRGARCGRARRAQRELTWDAVAARYRDAYRLALSPA